MGVPFENAIPILRVRRLGTALAHYTKVLGFEVDWDDSGTMASVSRDGCAVMLCEGGQGHAGTWVWFGVADAGALYNECRSAGATIRLPPTNYRWAYEMHVEDPDGHVLRFGSEPRTDRPFCEWVAWYETAASEPDE